VLMICGKEGLHDGPTCSSTACLESPESQNLQLQRFITASSLMSSIISSRIWSNLEARLSCTRPVCQSLQMPRFAHHVHPQLWLTFSSDTAPCRRIWDWE